LALPSRADETLPRNDDDQLSECSFFVLKQTQGDRNNAAATCNRLVSSRSAHAPLLCPLFWLSARASSLSLPRLRDQVPSPAKPRLPARPESFSPRVFCNGTVAIARPNCVVYATTSTINGVYQLFTSFIVDGTSREGYSHDMTLETNPMGTGAGERIKGVFR
jgi:hypothetical protein